MWAKADADYRQARVSRYTALEESLRIQATNAHPRGASAVLDVLREHLGEWVSVDALMAATGQRAIHSRVAELRPAFPVEWNGHGGRESRYRLVRR